jgi:hypothetical protein
VSCMKYTSSSSIPQGFGVPWDVLNPSIILISASCTPPMAVIKVGNPNTLSTMYIYGTAYAAPSGAQSWSRVDLFGSGLISGNWFRSSAQGTTNVGDLTTPGYIVGYVWNGIKLTAKPLLY